MPKKKKRKEKKRKKEREEGKETYSIQVNFYKLGLLRLPETKGQTQ
jgi:hypothetical protein